MLESVAVGRKLDMLLRLVGLGHRYVLVLEVSVMNEFHLTSSCLA